MSDLKKILEKAKMRNLTSSDKKSAAQKVLFRDIKHRNLSKTPVFALLFALVLIVNILVFFLTIAKSRIGIENLDSQLYTLFFGANHASSILQGKQFWRFLVFGFLENVQG